MREVMIGTKKTLVFVVTEGDAATVVIPLENLAPIDYRRISEMAAKGGELMAVMRETRLDNGMNALNQYKELFIVVPKDKKVAPRAATTADVSEASDGEPVRRGRGRPPKVQ